MTVRISEAEDEASTRLLLPGPQQTHPGPAGLPGGGGGDHSYSGSVTIIQRGDNNMSTLMGSDMISVFYFFTLHMVEVMGNIIIVIHTYTLSQQ